jgi:hypothetical protein
MSGQHQDRLGAGVESPPEPTAIRLDSGSPNRHLLGYIMLTLLLLAALVALAVWLLPAAPHLSLR